MKLRIFHITLFCFASLIFVYCAAKRPAVQIFYDPKSGKVIREEQDKNHDGKTDVWFFYTDGKLDRHEEDTDYDGKVDIWSYYKEDKTGKLQELRKDSNGDGKADLWIYYQNGKVTKQEVDLNYDGKIDLSQVCIPLDTQDMQWVPYLRQANKQIMKVWRYPKEVKAGLKGVAEVSFMVERDGSISRIWVIHSSGHPVLDRATTEALQQASPLQPLPLGVGQKSVLFSGKFKYNRAWQ